MRAPASPRLPWPAVLVLLAATSLLSHARAALPGLTYYFRDFTTAFIPLRMFSAAELRAGRWALWNPYVQEGTFMLPSCYLLDLLHVLRSDPATISWLLTLHYPIAALGCFALARELGVGRPGSFVAGSVYALGGLAASCLNLYLYLQALALAPLVALTLRRAAQRGGRSTALAALALGLCLTTLAIEFVAQATLVGAALGLLATPRRKAAVRLATAGAVGVGLAGLPVALMLGILGESVRGTGFGPSVALGNEIHPATLLQVLIPGLFGNLAAPVEEWWGGHFFSKGFPYFLSLYLGPVALSLAWVAPPGIEKRLRWLLLLLGGAALWYCLGERGGLAPLVSAIPFLRFVRFPSKAFLIPHLVMALLAGFGVERLRSGVGWPRFVAAAGGCGAAVVALFAYLLTRSGGGLVPWDFAGVQASIYRECSAAALLCLAAAALGAAVVRGLVSHRFGLVAVVGLLVFDMARASHGMNPQVDPAFFRLLPELAAADLAHLGGGRVFTYGVDYSPAFARFLQQPVPGRGLWSFFTSRQILAPYANMIDRVEAAEAKDLTSFVARLPELRPEDYDPTAVAGILDRLRDAAVSRLLSFDPLEHPDLRLRAAVRTGSPGLTIYVYELLRPWPRAYLTCAPDPALPAGEPSFPAADVQGAPAQPCAAGSVGILPSNAQEARYDVYAARSGYLVTRDTWARGWTATVDGQAARVLKADGKHRAVALDPGRHQIVLRYRAPGLLPGLALTVLSTLVTVVGLFRGPGGSDPLAVPPGARGPMDVPAPDRRRYRLRVRLRSHVMVLLFPALVVWRGLGRRRAGA